MSARTKARKRAMDMLFVADVMQRDLRDVLADEQAKALGEPEREASWRYARDIVTGYLEYEHDIDTRIEATAKDWTLERMPSVDAAILRIGAWEILYNDEVPVEVAINEAISAASEYSTDDSSRFISGVLGAIADAAKAS
ncbi:transcription antitermination factor NusB [Gulosibacter faecalis]|uniref:Transcription antitermination protein NusB n=1 Tax=Gulosibacter faecalis TaxID=272240 RepID=A0ABW5V275_9MICO|nr:transcription antitermination factor NusB [Gulosibacter faecalis]